MLGTPVDIAIIGVVAYVLLMKPPTGPFRTKPETLEKSPHSPKNPFPEPEKDLFIK